VLPEADRRLITVLFCDLAESTLLSARLDPEELHYVVRRYQAACADAIEQEGGHVAQYLGDGMLVYFGWPEAHEGDPRRAVRAALGIVSAVEELGEVVAQELGVELAVRVGLHTGPVVAGDVGVGARRERLALGLTPNVAAHVQVYAAPNTVVLSHEVWDRVHEFFDCEPLGRRRMKGLAAPIEIFRALRETGARSRFDTALRRGLLPAVGRERELRAVLERFARAQSGQGQVLLVRGEPGIGKSRLVHLVRDRTLPEQPLWLACGCDEITAASPFRPIVELCHELFAFEPGDTPEERVKKLETSLARHGDLDELVPVFCDFLSLPIGAGHARPMLAPPLLKTLAMERLAGLLVSLTRSQPVVLVTEDLHWADPSSLEFLRLLIGRIRGARMLLLLTIRSGFSVDLPANRDEELELARLGDADVDAMIEALTRGHPLPGAVHRQIVARAEGVPLFIEEFARMVSGLDGSGAGRRGLATLESAIPATLKELLAARLDRLGLARNLAHFAALIGREFSYELLRAVTGEDEERLRRDLERLVQADLVRARGQPPHKSYVFKHALIQDAAVASLLRSPRVDAHRRIAEALTERFPEIAESQPERVAHHWSEAGRVEPAVAAWLRAGQHALARSANVEALAHLERALALVTGQPDSPWRCAQELAVQSALGRAHSAVRGYAAPEVERSYSRALALCRDVEEAGELFWTLWGLHTYYTMRAQLQTAEDLALRMRKIAESLREPAWLSTAHYGLAVVHFFRGDASAALEHAGASYGLDTAEREHLHTSVASTVLDVGVVTRTLLGIVRAYRGEHDLALACGGEALALAERLDHPYSRACSLNENAWIHLMVRDADRTLDLAERAIAVCDAHGFALWSVVDHFVAGWAEARGARGASRNEARTGVERMRRHLEAYRGFGCRLSLPNWLSLFAETCVAHGLAEDARRALAEARAAAEAAGERGYDAEIERVAGELALLAGGSTAGATAEAHFRRALAHARASGSGAFALRAADRLARRLGDAGRRGEAADVLRSVVERLPDSRWSELSAARALLDALA
jgi:class 3 adenylate cyclase